MDFASTTLVAENRTRWKEVASNSYVSLRARRHTNLDNNRETPWSSGQSSSIMEQKVALRL